MGKGIVETKTEIPNNKETFGANPAVIDLLHAHRVVVVVPAFNEERFIGSVVLKILQFPVTVIVVDDGSTDNTSTIAEAAGALVLRHIKNMGKGEALNTGIIEARMMNPDAVVVIDGDGQHLAGELPRLVYPILEDEADIVVGSRYLEKTSDVPNHRVLGHRFFNRLTGMASRINVSDSQSGYRAFSPKAFKTDLFQSAGFSVESEMQFIAHEHNLRVVEVPITIRYTDKPKRPVIQQGVIVLNGILHLIGQYRPLLFFGLPGLIIILTGFGLGFLVINIYGRTKVLAVGYAMISVLLTVSGMVLFSTGIILHSIRGLLFEMLREKGHASVK